ncbi:MAG: PQQ-like beta-propeller repeat protein [Candidatus Sumerlaeota bacterium]|nr:PQQ-like beta-propeller repeat protein [Candidatus Sumerlaeota bacterium]
MKHCRGLQNRIHFLAALLAVYVFAVSCLAAETDNWPRFRGPNGSGLSDASLPAQWTEKEYHWKIEMPGGGHSSPVVWGDRIFLTSGLPATGKRIVLCVKASDGATLWKREFDSTTCTQNSLNSYGSTTPALDKDYVFVCWAVPKKYTLLALDHDGHDVWQRDLGPFASQHGHGASPIVFEDLVIVPNDQDGEGFLIAVDRRTGETRWQVKRRAGKAAYATPCVFQPEGGAAQLIFEGSEYGVTSVDPRTGKVNWEAADAFPKRVVASPVAGAGLILGQCGEGGVGQHVIAIRPGTGAQPPQTAWKVTKAAPYVPMPVIKGDLVFLWGDSGAVACVRASNGEDVWREKVGGNYFGSPICAGDKLYCISTKGEVVVLAAADKYQLLGRNPLGEKSHATPAIAGGRMYLRTFSHLISIGGK